MIVTELEAYNCFKYKKVQLSLPKKGLVLVTGANGAGKSSIIELVSAGVWGKTLRKTPAWRKDGSSGGIAVNADGRVIKRQRLKGKSVELSHTDTSDGEEKFATASKAQADLDTHTPEWDVWSKTSVFRADELGAFTQATDANRKRLLEKLTDSDRFDPALKRAREDKKVVSKQLVAVEKDIAVLKERKSGLESRLVELEQDVDNVELPEKTDTSELNKKLAKINKGGAATKKEIRALEEELDTYKNQQREAFIKHKMAKEAQKKFDIDHCPTCTQEIPESLKDKCKEDAALAEKELTTVKEKIDSITDGIKEDLADLKEHLETLVDRKHNIQRKISKAEDSIRAYAAAEKERRRRVDLLAKAKEKLKETEEELGTFQKKASELSTEKMEIVAAEDVLSVQGVRAHIMGKALDGIEAVTNVWLSKIGWDGLRIELKPYSETSKSDALADRISLKVHGCGDGYGYEAASRGERRRIDVAFIFAFGEYAAAAHGSDKGTLWMDEILDGLDEEGIVAVCEALRELSADRPVVLITHRPDLVSELKPERHLHVSEGVIEEVGRAVRS